MTIPEAIVSLVQKHRLKPPFLVGFSGGADSTALLLGMSQANIGEFTAVHFHHGLRSQEADDDEVWCRDFCLKRNIPFLSKHLDVPHNLQKGESCEEAARRLRLNAWQELCNGTYPIWLAHHADDALEELFLRLARGSNTSALVSLKPLRVLHGLTILRPLLNLRKRQLEDWLRSQGVDDWRIDSTNAQSDYRRNAVRNRLLPLFREIFMEDTGLLHALSALRDDAAFLDETAANAFASLRSLRDWQTLPPALLPRVLRLWLEANGISSLPTRPVITRLREVLPSTKQSSQKIPLDSTHFILLDDSGLSMRDRHGTAPEAIWKEQDWNWQETPCIQLGSYTLCVESLKEGALVERFDKAVLPPLLRIRHWQPGDRMVPFGATAPKKLQDLFTDAKIPREKRAELPILLAGDQIIWVPTVRRAAYGALHDKSSAVITISFKENPS